MTTCEDKLIERVCGTRRGAGSCGKGTGTRMNESGSFDRFTWRARQVMRLVKEEAQRLLNQQGRPMLVCSFCGKEQDQVQRLVAGPRGVAVCDECVATLSHGLEAPQEERGLRCSFCGKHQQEVPYLAIGPRGVNICQECLVLCQEIIAEV